MSWPWAVYNLLTRDVEPVDRHVDSVVHVVESVEPSYEVVDEYVIHVVEQLEPTSLPLPEEPIVVADGIPYEFREFTDEFTDEFT